MTAATSTTLTAEPTVASWLKPSARRDYLVLTSILVAAAAIRFWDLAGPSFWVDEFYSMNFARLPQQTLWSDWMMRETNPPLFYSLLNGWMALFGDGEIAVRALSAIFGVLAVGAIFLLTRELSTTSTALLAAALTAINSQQLEFSQQVRGYTLGILAAAFAILALVRLADRWTQPESPRRQPWPELLLYVGASTIAFYTHTTFFLLPLLANLYMAWVWAFRTPRRRDPALAWIGANLLLTLLCAWWLWMTYLQMQAGAGMIAWIEKPDLRMGALKLAHVMAPRALDPFNMALSALFGGLFAWGAWRLPIERRVLAFVFGAGMPLLLFAISQRQPIYMERTLFWAQAIYLPCIAAGILALPIKRLRAPVAVAACLLFLVDAISWRQREYREPWREIATVIGKRAGPKDAVLAYSRDATVNLGYYCRQTRCKDLAALAVRSPDGKNVLHFAFEGEQVDASNMATVLARFDRIWVVSRGPVDDPRPLVAAAAQLEADDILVTDPISDTFSAPPLNDMTLSIWEACREELTAMNGGSPGAAPHETSSANRDGGQPVRRPWFAAFLLGFALSGFFDGILLHQVLQWHHLLSGLENRGAPFADLRFQVLADGYFHLLMYLAAGAALVLLWQARKCFQFAGASRALLSWGLVGFGVWHFVDAIASHWVLGIHRIRTDAGDPLLWDVGWLALFGAIPLALGLWLRRAGGGPSGGVRGGGGAAVAGLALLTLGAGFWSAQRPAGVDLTAIVFSPAVSFDAGLRMAQDIGEVAWFDGGGVFVVRGASNAGWRLYGRGALFVTGVGMPPGCLGWART